MARITQAWWSMDSGAWDVQRSEECITLIPPDAGAALQVSAYRKNGAPVDHADHLFFGERARAESRGGSPTRAPVGEFDGITVEYEAADGVYWIRWWLWHGRVSLFVTWNSSAAPSAQHRREVGALLSTLHVRDA